MKRYEFDALIFKRYIALIMNCLNHILLVIYLKNTIQISSGVSQSRESIAINYLNHIESFRQVHLKTEVVNIIQTNLQIKIINMNIWIYNRWSSLSEYIIVVYYGEHYMILTDVIFHICMPFIASNFYHLHELWLVKSDVEHFYVN